MSNKIKIVNNKRNKINLSLYNFKNIKNPKNYEYWSSLVFEMPSKPLSVWSCGGGGGGGGGEDCAPDDKLPLCIYSK